MFEEPERRPEDAARTGRPRPAPEVSLLQLQRGAGNKAVADLLRAGRAAGQPALQRYFYVRGVNQRIDDPTYVLAYLIGHRRQLGITVKLAELKQRFKAVAYDTEEPTKFAAWLQDIAPGQKAEKVLSDAHDAAGGTTEPRKRKRAPSAGQEKKRRRIDEADDEAGAQMDVLETEVLSHLTADAPEPELESDSEDFEEDARFEFDPGPDAPGPGILAADDRLRILVITWNLEKSGSATREVKQRAIREIVDAYHPAVMVMQEVTDAGILFDGIATGGSNPVPYSLGINYMNLLHQAEQIELDAPADDSKMESDEPELPHYPLGNEYGMAEGPTYRSGTYRENYPLLYERTQVAEEPKAYFVHGKGSSYKLAPVAEGEEKSFGTETKTRREPLVWEIDMASSLFNLRSEVKLTENPDPGAQEWAQHTSQRRARAVTRQKMYVMVVHTSPSMSIKDEVADIMAKAEWLRKQKDDQGRPIPVILAGDWYMEKADNPRFTEFVEGKGNWSTAAAPVRPGDEIATEERKEYGEDKQQFIRTNQPGKGVGQAADHYVINQRFEQIRTDIIPAKPARNSPLTTAASDRQVDEKRDAYAWREQGVDHTPVVTYLSVSIHGKS